MKRLLVLCLFAFSVAFGQTADGEQLVTVKKKFVSQAGVSESVAAQNTASVSSYIGLGKEVGTAVKEGLTALTDEADRFSKTKPGEFVMMIIAFKVIGKPLMGFVVGMFLLIIGLPLWWITYRKNCFDTKYMSREVVDKEGKVTRDYQIKDRNASDGEHFLYYLFLLVWVGVCAIIMFA